MSAGRRHRRASGRVPGVVKGGASATKRAPGKGARRADKAALLAAAKAARAARGGAAPRLLALVPVSGGGDAVLAAVAGRVRSGGGGAAAAAGGSGRVEVVKVAREGGERRDWVVACLDAGKVADVVVFVFGGAEGVDEAGLEVIAAMRAQGLPNVVSVAVGAGSRDAGVRRERGRVLEAESLGESAALRPFDFGEGEGEGERMVDAAGDGEADGRGVAGFLRKVSGGKVKGLVWRRRYGYMLAEGARVVGDSGEGQVADGREVCRVEISGCVRGAGLSANRLVMITGVGAFKVERIVGEDGCVLGLRDADEDGDAEPAESEAEVDGIAGEQTWPPEMEDVGMGGVETVVKKRVPKGFSDYQAAWMPEIVVNGEVGADEEEEDEEEQEEDEVGDAESGGMDEVEDGNEDDDEGSDMEVDAEEVARARAAAAAEDNAKFPDEVDTPIDTPARVRFARYRGLKSFRTSVWDPKEQLPRAYARLFQFSDLAATRKRVLAESEAAASRGASGGGGGAGKPRVHAKCGTRVTMTLVDVPVAVAAQVAEVVAGGRSPVVVSGMLRHENRRSVVHFGLQRVDDEEAGGVVKAKSPLEIHSGFARFVGRPMFSEQNANSDKHKMERYLLHGRYTVASLYGPAVYAPAPALLFHPGGALIATGATLGADPDRIILKRIVLTGYPYKTQKKRTVVKFMFFNPEDIRWFRPVELWTKLGRTGHIVSPIGTHGRMKCIFDAAVLHHDTVCLTLYKRVYPKSIEQNEEE